MTRISVKKLLNQGNDKGIAQETVGTKTFLTTCQEMRTRRGKSHTHKHVLYTHIDMCMYTYIKKITTIGASVQQMSGGE